MTQTFDTNFGEVEVRNIMIDLDGTNLEEGIEITVPNVKQPIEIYGYRSVEDMTVNEVEELLEDNY